MDILFFRIRLSAFCCAIIAFKGVESQVQQCSIGQYWTSYGYCNYCSTAPANAYYVQPSYATASVCPWNCDSGYTLDTTKSYCTIQCQTGLYYDTTLDGCAPCSNGPLNSYYIGSGGVSSSGCSWACQDGYFEDNYACVRYDDYDWQPMVDQGLMNYQNTDCEVSAEAAGAILLFTIGTVIFFTRAKQVNNDVAPMPTPKECCVCIQTSQSRNGVFISAIVMAVIQLVLCAVADHSATNCKLTASTGLLGAAMFIGFFGPIVLYSLSSCGCKLCCVCPSAVCNRTSQATASIGISLTFFLLGLGLSAYCMCFVAISADLMTDSPANCLVYFAFASRGLIAWSGIFMAAALLLQGHFVTLVPEAIAYMQPLPNGDAAVIERSAGIVMIAPPGRNVKVDVPHAVVGVEQLPPAVAFGMA